MEQAAKPGRFSSIRPERHSGQAIFIVRASVDMPDVIPVFQQFEREGRRARAVYEKMNLPARAGQGNIEQPALFGMGIAVRLCKYESQQGIVFDFRWKAKSVGGQTQHDDVVGFQTPSLYGLSAAS